MMNTLKFFREVRAEMGKVTWPSLRDTRMLTIMVFVLVFILGMYLWVVDAVIGTAVEWLMRL